MSCSCASLFVKVDILDHSLGPQLRKEVLEGVLTFLSCGGGGKLSDYFLITLITKFLSPPRHKFPTTYFLNTVVS